MTERTRIGNMTVNAEIEITYRFWVRKKCSHPLFLPDFMSIQLKTTSRDNML